MKNNIIYSYKPYCLALLLSFTISFTTNAQPNRDKYRDKVWIFGGFSWHNYGLIFNNNGSTDTISYNASNSISAVSTSLCDTSGQLIAYSNGIYIVNKNHQKMINGDSLDFGQYWQIYSPYGSSGVQGGVTILPMPNVKKSALMLYHDIEPLSNGGYGCFGFKAAFIDLNRNNGNGVVVQKDIQVFQDSMQAPLITACRHANGRDWWLIGVKWGLDKYYKALVTPNGIVNKPTQIMPRVNTTVTDGSIIAKYSPDGAVYAHHNPKVGTFIYNFDRCTGQLSNRWLLPLFRNYRTFYCGIEFSPNSRYLYVTDDSQIVQYDMGATNIPASGIVVAQYDGFTDTSGFATFNTAFFLLQLAPNGKIYGNSIGGNRYLHIIHNPDERGLACNVEQHGLRLPTWYDSTMPNFPNFRLGAERGTVCDSLGIETGVTATTAAAPEGAESAQLSVSPNPTSGECLVSLLAPQKGVLHIYDAQSRLLATHDNPFQNQSNFTINLKNYAKGVYFIEFIANGGERARAKVLRQ
jgi:hypothetical protein